MAVAAPAVAPTDAAVAVVAPTIPPAVVNAAPTPPATVAAPVAAVATAPAPPKKPAAAAIMNGIGMLFSLILDKFIVYDKMQDKTAHGKLSPLPIFLITQATKLRALSLEIV
jgi:hypothetical protein